MALICTSSVFVISPWTVIALVQMAAIAALARRLAQTSFKLKGSVAWKKLTYLKWLHAARGAHMVVNEDIDAQVLHTKRSCPVLRQQVQATRSAMTSTSSSTTPPTADRPMYFRTCVHCNECFIYIGDD